MIFVLNNAIIYVFLWVYFSTLDLFIVLITFFGTWLGIFRAKINFYK